MQDSIYHITLTSQLIRDFRISNIKISALENAMFL